MTFTQMISKFWETMKFFWFTKIAEPPPPVIEPLCRYLGCEKLCHLKPILFSCTTILLLCSFLLTSCHVSDIWTTSMVWLSSFLIRSSKFGKTERALAEYILGRALNWSSTWWREGEILEDAKDDNEEEEDMESLPSHYRIMELHSSLKFSVKTPGI